MDPSHRQVIPSLQSTWHFTLAVLLRQKPVSLEKWYYGIFLQEPSVLHSNHTFNASVKKCGHFQTQHNRVSSPLIFPALEKPCYKPNMSSVANTEMCCVETRIRKSPKFSFGNEIKMLPIRSIFLLAAALRNRISVLWGILLYFSPQLRSFKEHWAKCK